MRDRIFILEMFNKMDDDFKKENEMRLNSMLSYYDCLLLHKSDLIDYVENEYDTDEKTRTNLLDHIGSLDENEMQNIADNFANDAIMESFWCCVVNTLDEFVKEIAVR